MKKKPLFLMLGVLFLLAATLLGMATILKNDILKYIGFSVGAIFLIALFIILIKLSLSTKNYYKSFNYYYDNMLYEEGKDYFLKELPTITNNAIKTQASYYLLTFYLLLDDLEKSKELLKNTIWGNYFVHNFESFHFSYRLPLNYHPINQIEYQNIKHIQNNI